MIEINLIPDVKKELIKANKTRNFVVTIAMFVGMASVGVVIILGLVIAGQNFTISKQDEAITNNNKKLSQVDDLTKMLTIQRQLGAIPALNDGKPITSRVMELLGVIGSSSSGNIEISNFSLDVATNTLQIEGQTPDGYPAIETMVKTINKATLSYTVREDKTLSEDSENETSDTSTEEALSPEKLLTEDLTLGEVTYGRDTDGQESARFQITLMLNEEFLNVKNEDVRVRVLYNGNATDSFLGVPTSIFAERAKDLKNEQEVR